MSCPNADNELEPIHICDMCEEGIYEGDTYYQIGDNYYCEGCIGSCKFTAEYDEPDVYEPDPMDIWKADIERRMCNGEL